MAIQTVRSNDLNSAHLGKFVAILSVHRKQRTLCIGRLIAIDHVLDDRDTKQDLTVALTEHETVQYRSNYSDVDVADEPLELLLYLADKARAEK